MIFRVFSNSILLPVFLVNKNTQPLSCVSLYSYHPNLKVLLKYSFNISLCLYDILIRESMSSFEKNFNLKSLRY